MLKVKTVEFTNNSASDRRGNGDNLGTISHAFQLKHILLPVIKTVSSRQF